MLLAGVTLQCAVIAIRVRETFPSTSTTHCVIPIRGHNVRAENKMSTMLPSASETLFHRCNPVVTLGPDKAMKAPSSVFYECLKPHSVLVQLQRPAPSE